MMHTRSQKLAFAVVTFAIALLHVCVLVNAYGHMHHQSPNRSRLNPVNPNPRLQVSNPTHWGVERTHWDLVLQYYYPSADTFQRYQLGDSLFNHVSWLPRTEWPTFVAAAPPRGGSRAQEIYHQGKRGVLYLGYFVSWDDLYAHTDRHTVAAIQQRLSTTSSLRHSSKKDVFEDEDPNAAWPTALVWFAQHVLLPFAISLFGSWTYDQLKDDDDKDEEPYPGPYPHPPRPGPQPMPPWEQQSMGAMKAVGMMKGNGVPRMPIRFRGSIRVRGTDDEMWPQSDEHVDRSKNISFVYLLDGRPVRFSPYHVRWGGECRVEVDLAARLVRLGEVEMMVRTKLFEGTSESTNDLEDVETRRFRLNYPPTKNSLGNTVSRVIELRNTEPNGGDTATIELNFRVATSW